MCMGGSSPAPAPAPAPAAPRAVEVPDPPKLQDDASTGSEGDSLESKRKGRNSLVIQKAGVNVAGSSGGTSGVNLPTGSV